MKPNPTTFVRQRCAWPLFAYVGLGLALAMACADRIRAAEPPAAVNSPLSPDQSLKHFQLPEDLAIEVVAAEPEVVDPVAIRFDEAGRMWVVEMRDYPLGPPKGEPPLSKIKVLEDRNADGRYETATVFAENLSFVTGVQPWRGGVIVTLAGQVAYMKDTDGDGKADVNEIWFTGFAQENSQLRANHPTLALDNWVYVAGGLRGGKIVDPRKPDQPPIAISGMDFRFDPLTGKAEAVAGNGQFGLCFDDAGNRFVCSNRNPLRHVVIEDRYLKRNPRVAVPQAVQDVCAAAEQSRIYPISRAWTTSNLHAGQFTAACGCQIYRGDALPEFYRGAAFTCDPTGNLVHMEKLTPDGPTFKGEPAFKEKEFLASPDEWFRPVNLENGPDGCLYIVDMYRAIIEHPDWVPQELKKRPDERFGDDKGRIYRIVPKKGKVRRELPSLAKADDADLLAALQHPNAWQRETSQRLILEHPDRRKEMQSALVSALNALLPNERPNTGRLHLLAMLIVSDAKSAKLALRGGPIGRDVDLGSIGLRAIEHWIQAGHDEDVLGRFIVCTQVKLIHQAILTSLVRQEGANPKLLAVAANSFGQDPWMRIAIRLAVRNQSGALLSELLATERRQELDELLLDLAEDAGQQSPVEQLIYLVLKSSDGVADMGAAHWRLLTAINQGLNRRGQNLKTVLQANEKGAQIYSQVLASAAMASRDGQRAAKERLDALALLAFDPSLANELAEIAADDAEQPIRIAALHALKRNSDGPLWNRLLSRFPRETPAVRRAMLDQVLGDAKRAAVLLDEIEAGRIKAAELDPAQMNRLKQLGNAEFKARVGKLLAAATPADRAQALADYQKAIEMPNDPKRGQAIFQKNCATCHKIGEIGVNVAPDISDSRTKTPAQILADVIQPNRAIDANYLAYNVRLEDGETLTGILAAETATSITLRQPGDKTLTLSRSEIADLKSSGLSLMPDGLERQIPLQDMADLISFVKNWRYLDGKTPLGK